VISVAPSGLDHLVVRTQDSQSLALGLTLFAAPQLVSHGFFEVRREPGFTSLKRDLNESANEIN